MNNTLSDIQGAIIGYVAAPAFGLSREQGAAIGFGMGKNYEAKHKDSGLQKAINKSDLGRSDLGKFDNKFVQTASNYLKDPWTTVKNGDIGRSDIGQAGLHALGEIESFLQNPIDYIEHGDLAHSALGRFATNRWRFQKALWRNPTEAIANSDLGKGDLGRLYNRNKSCTGLAITIIISIAAPEISVSEAIFTVLLAAEPAIAAYSFLSLGRDMNMCLTGSDPEFHGFTP